MRRLAIIVALALAVSSCSDAATTTTPAPPATAATTTTTTAPTTTTTTTTSLPPAAGTTLADVVAYVQADLQARFDAGDPPPGVEGPFLVTCENAEAVPARFGDVFACPGLPQATIELDPVGVVMIVVSDDGVARWLAGTDIPDNQERLEAAWAADAGRHFCRELAAEAGVVFSVGYVGAVAYWFMEGMPERMDADLDGVPCETVFSYEEMIAVWGGLAQEALLPARRADYDFGYVTEVASDGSSLTIDFAEFLTGEEANEAARAAGEIGPDDVVPNDYFISNTNPRLRTFPIADDVMVQLVGFLIEGGEIDTIGIPPSEWAELVAFALQCIADEFPEECVDIGGEGWIWYGSGFLPYWILVEDGVVVAIEEQYLP